MAAPMKLTAEVICKRQLQFIVKFPTRQLRNTRIQHFDIPPDKPKPIPLNVAPLSPDEKIVIPLKKKRDSLSILRALADTVKKDPLASHYMYMDDPYLLPTDNLTRRNSLLSKASGRKVARLMINKYPRYIEDITPAHPPVPALEPESVDYKSTEPSENALQERIEKRAVGDAYDMYRAMKREGISLNQDLHQQLLELLCVYNSRDPHQNLEEEEFWLRRDMEQCEFSNREGWKTNGPADEVFDDLPEQTPQAYDCMIRGFVKYADHTKAHEYYTRAKEKGINLSSGTYEKILLLNQSHLDTYDERLGAVVDILRDYHSEGHPPTLAVFNSALATAAAMCKSRSSLSFCLCLLAEMRQCNIEPSLGTWHYVLSCFYPTKFAESNGLYDVMSEIENKELTIRHPSDVQFFLTAMTRCTNNLRDLDMAYRIDDLLNKGDVHQLLSNAYYLTIY